MKIAAHVALILMGVGFALVLIILALVVGCRTAALPPEPPYVETVSRDR